MTDVYELRRDPRNRALYDLTLSRKVKADRVVELLQGGIVVKVTDTVTGDDVTEYVLSRIVCDLATRGVIGHQAELTALVLKMANSALE